ncbi:MAG: dihydrofolate reductase family protein [Sphingobium sp.]
MRKIVGGAFLSLDGVMQAPGAPNEDRTGGFELGGWLFPFSDDALNNQIGTLFQVPFDLLLGRRTYEIFAAYWPYIPDDNPIAALFWKVRKYVLTSSDEALEWGGSYRLADLDALAALKEEDGPDLVIQGSTTLYPQLFERGLIDRLITMTAPVVLGQGKKMFGADTMATRLRLIEHRLTSTGMSLATYEPAGEVGTGMFGEDNPSEAELARRERWHKEDIR